MGKIIVVMVFVIIMQFAMKKDYKELLVFLIKFLILDWIFVKLFSTIPYIRTIVFLFGEPMLSVLIYAIIELISMGIFYYALQKCNSIISLIVYLVINVIIGKFYTTISGSIVLDLLFNFIIGIIMIIIYRRSIRMEEIENFAIIGMIMNAILAPIWKIVGGMIFLGILFFGTFFSPYILGVILSATVIWLVRKKLGQKDKEFRILVYVMIILICGYVSVKTGYAFLLYESAKPDNLYVEMNEINDNQSLIGLSKEEVVEKLGKPKYEVNDDINVYEYGAGKISNMLFFGESDFYNFRIVFDENDKVKSTSIRMLD